MRSSQLVRQSSRTASFFLAGGSGAALLTASAAPSPLYPVYQRLWGFSALTLTVIFAVYVFALMASLITVGSISDRVGRRPLAIGAMVLLAISMLLFVFAGSVGGLLAARIVQGIAVGAATGAISAMIIDLQPHARAGSMVSSAAPAIGMAVGAMAAGVLVDYAPWPRYLVYWLLAGLYLVLAILLARLPQEQRRSADGRSVFRALRPSVGLPAEIRAGFLAVVPAMAATWALGGLYLSLGTSIVARVLGVHSHAVAGLVLGAFFGSGAIGGALSGRLPERLRERVGLTGLGIGVLITLIAALLPSTPLYVLGSVVAGAGFGATFRAVIAEVAALTPALQRGRVFATMYLLSYTAFSVPALVAGLLTGVVGLRDTTIGYVALDALLVAAAMIISLVRARRAMRLAATAPAAIPGLAPCGRTTS
ncbi:MFS transporter [Microlunatus soli]|uniref:Predicted arabinose efflux permease, MFS family n=1 Tax=Microlunatus soli TaxID=630515 RepID=A0A1H1W3K2_9ACTN|nr:MFS transporter [Microlunatus soli]SDS91251.1 Predicted arabinose efflux permease, MFS family [Microlunatus soli]